MNAKPGYSIEKLRALVEKAKGLEVELTIEDELTSAAALPITNLHVGFKGPGGNKFICLSSLWASIAALGDDAQARTLDFFGSPRAEVVLGGKVGGQNFNIIIRP